jgi:hypothetical protein
LGSCIEPKHDLVRFLAARMSELATLAHDMGSRTSSAHESTGRCRGQRERKADGLVPAFMTAGAVVCDFVIGSPRWFRIPLTRALIQ